MAATVTPRRIRIAATVSAVVLGGSFLGASAAQAVAPTAGTQDSKTTAAAHPHRPFGIVTARTGLNVRQFPSTDSSVRGVLRHHQKVGLDCKVHAQNIRGNSLWYKLRGSNEAWVAARYVHNVGFVPLCKDRYRTALNNTAESRKAMG
jgi:hypothetical protein